MRAGRTVLTCLLAIALGTGCTVAGTARPAPGLKPHPVTGQPVKKVLLDDGELSKLLGQSFGAKTELPARFGGPEVLPPAFGAVSPLNCVGVTSMMVKNAYQSGDVKNAARETWWNMRGPAKVISVAEGVVALSSTAGATALFQQFSQQWRDCDGTIVTIGRPSIITDRPSIVFLDTISDVRVADSVVAATLSIDTQLPGIPSTGPRPEARAIGVRGNCLVEVDVAFFGSTSPSDQGSGDVHRTAIDIAHALMDKVSALS
ncbi:sensor domain-containing protein [Mycobacterium nebraskense]|uniref:sensor domain-containing protein n=1 Tax=Mycobacterium nebraskense TaxID=244292 RepID=UPI000617FA04|nr:sensor domain-containing protein [Mycobacterium nebraskense]KKC03417.1 LppR [Mycobacterium nebraskense]KLO40193.1 LppR [Mycobacterium nebraskense]MBI2692944.1 sensor domain-containing protein [Mycobacterium nebraskense]